MTFRDEKLSYDLGYADREADNPKRKPQDFEDKPYAARFWYAHYSNGYDDCDSDIQEEEECESVY